MQRFIDYQTVSRVIYIRYGSVYSDRAKYGMAKRIDYATGKIAVVFDSDLAVKKKKEQLISPKHLVLIVGTQLIMPGQPVPPEDRVYLDTGLFRKVGCIRCKELVDTPNIIDCPVLCKKCGREILKLKLRECNRPG